MQQSAAANRLRPAGRTLWALRRFIQHWINRPSARSLRVVLRYPSVMDILKMLLDLRQEREQIGEAIVVLERLAGRSEKRRGRPPAWMAAVKGKTKKLGRPPGSKNKN